MIIMSAKTNKYIYLISTGLLTLLMCFSAGMYFFNYDMVVEAFSTLGYPPYLIYPLAIAKILGLIAIWTKKSVRLKEWAYAGFFFDLLLALVAHLHIQDNQWQAALFGLVMLAVSISYEKRF